MPVQKVFNGTDWVSVDSAISSIYVTKNEIELHTSGIWNWIVYPDKTCDLYGKIVCNNINIGTSKTWGSWYYEEIAGVSFPVTFTAIPTFLYSWNSTDGGLCVPTGAPHTVDGLKVDKSPNLYLIRPSAATISGTIDVYAHGKIV